VSRNSIKLLWVVWIIALSVDAAAPASQKISEDALIIEALFEEQMGKLNKSRKIFEKLYKLTGKKEYLIQEAKDTLVQKDDPSHSIDNLVEWVTAHPQERDAALYRILVALYIEQGSLEDAEDVADAYLSADAPVEDQIAVAALKLELNKPQEAVALLRKAYKNEKNEKILLQLVSLMDKELNKRKEAIEILQKYIDENEDASIGSYFKLIELYAKEKKLTEVANLYKQLYKKDPQKYFLQKIIEISLYQKDIDGVITFLEKNKGNEDILFTFYKEKRQYPEAIAMAQKLYQKTAEPRWLAEEGMMIYEQAKKRSRAIDPHALKKMRELLEKALKKGLKDPLYFNYYGYTLIDHDLDIDKGIALVEKALKQEPKNTYYLDSLAWGLYKKGNCDKAYELMKQVVAKEGLEEEEIKIHWDLIRKCYLK